MNAIDAKISQLWNRLSVREKAMALFGVAIGGACLSIGTAVVALVAYLHYLIRTGQFID